MKWQNTPDWLAQLGGANSQNEIGTKAHNLSILFELGFLVPPCVFITTLHSRHAQFDTADSYLASIDEFSRELDQLLPSANGWAVRSSATIEDMPGESQAGRFETLFISDVADLANAVKAVWDSGRAADIGPDSMGVIIQQLIDADFAGVAFSHDPTTNDHTTVIEGVPGNAARFVDGELTPWRVRPGAPDILLPDNLEMNIVKALDDGVQRLAVRLDMAVDTEWALSDGQLYWLQVRPLTGSSAIEFVIPDSQVLELKGLWVRINHSYAPQASLVASMNPGGYFDGPGWTSRLVNNFHYIQEDKRTKEAVPQQDFDKILDEWDRWERQFGHLFEERQQVNLADLGSSELWGETLQRIELSQKTFTMYSDRRFLEIRDRTEQRVNESISYALGDDPSSRIVTGQLLGQLGSLTEEKQISLKRLAKLHALDQTKDIREAPEWREFIESFGYESPTPHLFYLPTLRETPDLIVEMVDQISRSTIEVRESVKWQTVAASISGKLPEDKRSAFMTHLARLRRCLLRTENDDYALARCTMLVRDVYLEAGRRLVADEVIGDCDDVFHMTGSELHAAVSGSTEGIILSTIDKRKKEFEQSRLLSPPPMIMNGRAMRPKAGKARTLLSGTPASPGVASGIVLVLNDPFSCVGKQLPKNTVVVAPIVTPALAYSLIGCAAIVTEIGGLASHGAIVAREMAIPAVVGVSNARSMLLTGMSVAVDGSQGEINILGGGRS